MTKQYTIILSDAQDKALSTVAINQEEWITNFVYERCRIAIDEIVNTEVQRKLEAGEPIVGTKEDIVMSANVETALEKEARLKAEFEELMNKG